VPGPEICTFSYSVHRFLPAGTRCAFDVTIDYQASGTIYFFDNPPRAVAHTVAVGTATGNGHTLIRTARFTETASPEIVFTDHGLLGRYSLPGGGTVTVFAGYDRDSILPPEPEVFHRNPFDDQDVAAFCADVLLLLRRGTLERYPRRLRAESVVLSDSRRTSRAPRRSIGRSRARPTPAALHLRNPPADARARSTAAPRARGRNVT
jgi:hypothetical protein